MPLHDFRGLEAKIRCATADLLLAQFSPRWAADDRAIERLRDRIDDAVLSRLLGEHVRAMDRALLRPRLCRRGRAENPLTVRRLVLYDLPEDWRGGTHGERHREWVERLRRDVAYVGGGQYEIKQWVLATAGPDSRPPREIVRFSADCDFEHMWKDGERAFAVRPGPTTATGFYGDEDPLYHLDLDVRDTDRLQIGPEQRRERVPRDPEAEL